VSQLHVDVERPIAAPAEEVYRYIADFQNHHPRWVPPAFSDFRVEQGGYGAGTVHSFQVTLGGTTRRYRTRVEEPVPGQVLTETDDAAKTVTTFTVTPEGATCRVRFDTDWAAASGIMGLFERLVAPRMMRGLYADQLARLDRYARERV
jgi:uncharacterized protein YndB with AHSA1/START domain